MAAGCAVWKGAGEEQETHDTIAPAAHNFHSSLSLALLCALSLSASAGMGHVMLRSCVWKLPHFLK